jgi:hypothetical protein
MINRTLKTGSVLDKKDISKHVLTEKKWDDIGVQRETRHRKSLCLFAFQSGM